MTTPEEDMGHAKPQTHFVPPPTIQQIASGVATRSPTRIYDRPPSSSSSASSTNSSALTPPLRSSLKKTPTNTSVASSATSRSSSHTRSFAVRHLFRHAKMPTTVSESAIDDTGSLHSDQSAGTRRAAGRVRFSDDEDADHSGRAPTILGIAIPPPPGVASSSSSSAPGKLSHTRKNVMKMFHRVSNLFPRFFWSIDGVEYSLEDYFSLRNCFVQHPYLSFFLFFRLQHSPG